MTKSNNHFVLFTIDEQSFALPLPTVERIARAVEVTPLPDAPGVVQGVVNVHGRIVPVVDTRRRFRLPEREMELEDHLIIGHTSKQSLAIRVDDVADIIHIPEKRIVKQKDILPDLPYVDGVVKLDGDIILIHDFERCFSIEEEQILEQAIHNVLEQQDKKVKQRGKKGL